MSEDRKRTTFARLNRDGLIEIVCEETGNILAIQEDYRDHFLPENLVTHTLRDGSEIQASKTMNLDKSYYHSPSYSEVLADIICQRIAEGESISKIAKDPDMPSYSTLARWRRMNPDFSDAIQLAMEDRATVYHDRAIEVAETTVDKDEVPQNRLKVDTFKWAAEKGNPKAYGKQMTVKGDEAAPLKLIIDTGVPQVEAGDSGEREVEEVDGGELDSGPDLGSEVIDSEVEEIKGAIDGDTETES